ncbi:MAG: hypothetical protein WC823_06365 [Parcubacteria group bacterium]
MQKIKSKLFVATGIGILFATGIMFSHAFTKTKLGTPIALGEENNGDMQKSKDEQKGDDSSDTHEEAKQNEDVKKEEDDANGDDQERQEVKATERKTVQVRTSEEMKEGEQKEKNQQEGADDQDEDINEQGDNENDAQEGVRELNKDIQKVESKIGVLGVNGIPAASLIATLLEVKDLANQAQSKMTAAPVEAEILIKDAKHKLERLERLVKMTLGDEDENNDDNDANEEIQDLAKDIAKIEVNLNAASTSGVDVSALKLSLDSVKELLNQAKEKAMVGDLAGAEALAEIADKKLETLRYVMKLTLGSDDLEEGDEADEYKNEVAQLVHNLKEIGDIDSGIGQQIKLVAQAQNESQVKVENSINDINERSGFAKFLVGPKYDSLAAVQMVIVENQTRIKLLTELTQQITDPAVKLVLQDQVTSLQAQNTQLQTFVTKIEGGVSLFGWLAKMLA